MLFGVSDVKGDKAPVQTLQNGLVKGVSVFQSESHAANAMWIETAIGDLDLLNAGDRFNVTVWMNLTVPSYVWQAGLRFNATHLQAVRAGYTGNGKSLYFGSLGTIPVSPVVDNSLGCLLICESLVGSYQAPPSCNILFWVEFEVAAPFAETTLYFEFDDTFILDPDLYDIWFDRYDEVVDNSWSGLAISVEPHVYLAALNTPFNVSIHVNNANDLYGWELKLYYERAMLNCTDAVEGAFLKSGGTTVWLINSKPEYNETHGQINIGASLMGEVPGVNGNGTLATICLDPVQLGNTFLRISDDILDVVVMDSQLGDIPYKRANGLVNVGLHDVAVLNVSPNKRVVGQNCTMNMTVTVQNGGIVSETFNVTVYCNLTVVSVLQIQSLPANENWTIPFTWNATGSPYGNYTLSATADLIPGEVHIDDNTLTNGTLYVGLVGDVNGDGKVDMRDIGPLARAFGCTMIDLWYKAEYDLTNDGIVNMRDIAPACRNFGKECLP
jgi:hypothetical protein